MKGNTPFEAYFGHKPDVSNFRVFGSTAWAWIPHEKRKDLKPKIVECLFIGYPEEYKEFNLLNFRTKKIFIEINVRFEEPLQEVELVKEKTAEIPSYSADYSDDEIGSDGSDFADMMYEISQQKKYQVQNHILKCKHISQLGPRRHSLLPRKTLEILLIQEELSLIL